MRLDYFCRLVVTDKNDRLITKQKTLQKLHNFVELSDGSDFTTYLEDTLDGAQLLGEPIRFIYQKDECRLFARASIHEKTPLSQQEIAMLSDHVQGQFIDGYGEEPINIRKGLARYVIIFEHDEISGPVKMDVPRPKLKRVRHKKNQIEKLAQCTLNGDIDGVRDLLDKGAPINGIPKQEEAHDSVMSAIGWAANRDHFEIARLLVSRGADPNIQGSSGDTPLMLASSIDMMELLLEAGADTEIKNDRGQDILAYLREQAEWWDKFERPKTEPYTRLPAMVKWMEKYIRAHEAL